MFHSTRPLARNGPVRPSFAKRALNRDGRKQRNRDLGGLPCLTIIRPRTSGSQRRAAPEDQKRLRPEAFPPRSHRSRIGLIHRRGLLHAAPAGAFVTTFLRRGSNGHTRIGSFLAVPNGRQRSPRERVRSWRNGFATAQICLINPQALCAKTRASTRISWRGALGNAPISTRPPESVVLARACATSSGIGTSSTVIGRTFALATRLPCGSTTVSWSSGWLRV